MSKCHRGYVAGARVRVRIFFTPTRGSKIKGVNVRVIGTLYMYKPLSHSMFSVTSCPCSIHTHIFPRGDFLFPRSLSTAGRLVITESNSVTQVYHTLFNVEKLGTTIIGVVRSSSRSSQDRTLSKLTLKLCG